MYAVKYSEDQLQYHKNKNLFSSKIKNFSKTFYVAYADADLTIFQHF